MMNLILVLFSMIIILDLAFDVIFKRMGRLIYSLIIQKEIDDEEYQRKSFLFRTIGLVLSLTIYALVFKLFGE